MAATSSDSSKKDGLVPEPTLVFYKAATCTHCTALSNIWESVKIAVKAVAPNIRFFVVTARDLGGKFDENINPKGLARYAKWFPIILLVPGKVWDAAMTSLGPRNPIEIRDGVQIMNGKWSGDKLYPNGLYPLEHIGNIYKVQTPSEFGRWVKDAMQHPEFKKYQDITVETTPAPSLPSSVPTPIPSLLSGLSRPITTPIEKDASIPAVSSRSPSAGREKGSGVPSGEIQLRASSHRHRHRTSPKPSGEDNVCNMRIIARPR